MADTNTVYSDTTIMKALLSKDFSLTGGAFEDGELTEIRKCAFQGAGSTLTKVVLPKITSVPSAAFRGCSGLTTLDIPWSTITGVGGDAFREAKLPDGDISLPNVTTLGDGAFYQCAGLKSVSIPGVTNAGGSDATYGSAQQGIFRDCTSLVSASLPALRTGPQYLFRGCTALKSVTLTAMTQTGGNTFQGCTALEKVKFPAAVTAMSGNVFNGATSLTAIIFAGITSIPSATSSTWSGSAVLSGTCYIYVPQALLESAKSASNWTSVASMIRAIEDWPDQM